MKKTMQLDFTNQIAHIEIGEHEGKKVITKTWGKDFGWSQTDAKQVIDMHARYIANLNAAGIETSVNIDENVIAGQNGEWYAQSREEYFSQGDLLANLMASTDKADFLKKVEEQVQLTAKMLFSIPPLRAQRYGTEWLWMSVPLDLKPPNAVLSGGHLVLVDTFRPLLWEDDQVVLKAMPGPHKSKQKLPNDEIKTGDIRFQAGRLFGYFVAVATRWYIKQNVESTSEELDVFRHELSIIIIGIVKGELGKSHAFTKELASALVADVNEIADESITVGSYEGPRYVQSLYEKEEQLFSAKE